MWVPNCPCLIYHHRTDDGAGKDQRARSSTDTARGGFVGTVMMHLLPIYPSRRQRVSFVPGERILGSAPTTKPRSWVAHTQKAHRKQPDSMIRDGL